MHCTTSANLECGPEVNNPAPHQLLLPFIMLDPQNREVVTPPEKAIPHAAENRTPVPRVGDPGLGARPTSFRAFTFVSAEALGTHGIGLQEEALGILAQTRPHPRENRLGAFGERSERPRVGDRVVVVPAMIRPPCCCARGCSPGTERVAASGGGSSLLRLLLRTSNEAPFRRAPRGADIRSAGRRGPPGERWRERRSPRNMVLVVLVSGGTSRGRCCWRSAR